MDHEWHSHIYGAMGAVGGPLLAVETPIGVRDQIEVAGTAVIERVRGLERWLVAPMIAIALSILTFVIGKLLDWI